MKNIRQLAKTESVHIFKKLFQANWIYNKAKCPVPAHNLMIYDTFFVGNLDISLKKLQWSFIDEN